jgi:hypothetical protein
MVSHTGVKGVSWSIFSVCSQPYTSTAQNSCVPSVSKTLGSNRIIPDISESTTRTRVKESRPGPLVGGGVGHAVIRTSDPYDS